MDYAEQKNNPVYTVIQKYRGERIWEDLEVILIVHLTLMFNCQNSSNCILTFVHLNIWIIIPSIVNCK